MERSSEDQAESQWLNGCFSFTLALWQFPMGSSSVNKQDLAKQASTQGWKKTRFLKKFLGF